MTKKIHYRKDLVLIPRDQIQGIDLPLLLGRLRTDTAGVKETTHCIEVVTTGEKYTTAFGESDTDLVKNMKAMERVASAIYSVLPLDSMRSVRLHISAEWNVSILVKSELMENELRLIRESPSAPVKALLLTGPRQPAEIRSKLIKGLSSLGHVVERTNDSWPFSISLADEIIDMSLLLELYFTWRESLCGLGVCVRAQSGAE